jgi:hypothetical protein
VKLSEITVELSLESWKAFYENVGKTDLKVPEMFSFPHDFIEAE